MANLMPISCGHPQHAQNTGQPGWNDGVLARLERPVELWCLGCRNFDAEQPPPVEVQNEQTLRERVAIALQVNQTFLALNAPSPAQAAQQVQALTRQVQALIRLLITQDTSSIAGS